MIFLSNVLGDAKNLLMEFDSIFEITEAVISKTDVWMSYTQIQFLLIASNFFGNRNTFQMELNSFLKITEGIIRVA